VPDPTSASTALTGQPPMGAAPVGVPSGSPGKSANALARVREALKILNSELPNLEPGSDPYKAVYEAIGKLSKVAPPSAEVPGVQKTALRGLGQEAQQSSMMQALMRSMGGGAGAGSASPGPTDMGAAAAA